MRKRWLISALLLATGSFGAPLGAQTTPTPLPTVATGVCLAEASLLARLDERTYAVAITTLDGREGEVSGTISLFAGNQRFDVPFGSLHAVADRDFEQSTPIVVRFQTPIKLEYVSLASVAGPDGGPCVPFIIPRWDQFSRNPPPEPFVKRAVLQKPLEAAGPIPLTPPNCEKPYSPARTIKTVQPSAVTRVPLAAGITVATVMVKIDVIIDDLGRVVLARIRDSGGKVLDDSALYSAKRTTYAPEIFRCQPVGGRYLFIVAFPGS